MWPRAKLLEMRQFAGSANCSRNPEEGKGKHCSRFPAGSVRVAHTATATICWLQKEESHDGTGLAGTVAAFLWEACASPTGRRLQSAGCRQKEPHDETHHTAL